MDEGEGIGGVAPMATRTPIILVVDVSESMNTVIQTLQGRIKPRIEQVNDHLSRFSKKSAPLSDDRSTASIVELAVVTFGEEVSIAQPFALFEDWTPQTLSASGKAPLKDGLIRAVEVWVDQEEQYRDHGIPYKPPQLFLISDGEHIDIEKEDGRVVRDLLKSGIKEHRISSFVCIGVGGADFSTLDMIYDSDVDPLCGTISTVPLENNVFEEHIVFDRLTKTIPQSIDHGEGLSQMAETDDHCPECATQLSEYDDEEHLQYCPVCGLSLE